MTKRLQWGAAVVAIGLTIATAAKAATVVEPNAKPTPGQAAAVLKAVTPGMRDGKFTVGTADLNGDGRLDLIAQYQGGMWCGSGGCSAVAVLAVAKGYSAKAITLPNFTEHVAILDASHHGMHDLKFDDAHKVFRWSGKTYK